MNAPQFLIKSIRFYFSVFIIVILTLLAFVDFSLFNEGQKIRETVQKQTQLQANKEIEAAFDVSYLNIRQEMKRLIEWDEIHQQFADPSYYFFWHDERLIESAYFKPYYDELELYGPNKKLLMPSSPDKKYHFNLPERINQTSATVYIKENLESHLVIFEAVKARDSGKIIGYVGISIDLLPMLFSKNTFYSINKSTIRITAENDFAYKDILQHIEYEPLTNPVSDYLWQLIQEFIIELILLMITITLILSWIFNITIYKPLETISEYLHLLKTRPNETHPIPEERFFLKEYEELKVSLHDYHRDLQYTQEKLDVQNQTVWEQARRDGLTNVLNRRAFDEAWMETVDDYSRYKTPTVFLLFDCDFFKALNDTYGHDIGDEVIKLSALTIQQALPIGVSAYRIGGDEFAIILSDCEAEQGMEVAEKSLSALHEAPFASLGIKEKLTFSIGMSSTTGDGDNDIANLPRQADMAMYKAKQSVREKIQCYHNNIAKDTQTMVSNMLVNTIVDAINSGKYIEMHFQAVKKLDSNEVYYESLIRMNKEGEIIYPRDIFTVVDRRRLEVELDRQVISQVHRILHENRIPKKSGLSINISGKTLLQPFFPDLFKTLKPYLKDYKIILEITENSLIDHMEYATQVLNNLRQDGFLIALDDFGSGYSSIRYLANMPVDIIKFDMSMTQALLSKDKNTQQIIKTTAEMVVNAGYDLVMEGIETEELLAAVKNSGATHIQGYLLGRPQKTPQIFND